jgi:acetylornithine/succinyldiaminopimelate/putrescine aminotransferase
LGQRLQALAADPSVPAAAEARGVGLLRGIAVAENHDPGAILGEIRKRQVLLSIAGGKVLRFSPPLCVSQAEIDEGLVVVEAALRASKPRK